MGETGDLNHPPLRVRATALAYTPSMANPPLVVFGGSFDPPHNAHLLAAECARAHLGAEHVAFLPTGDAYHKQPGNPSAFPSQVRGRTRQASPAAQRLEMLRLAVASNPGFLVDDREMRREGPTYTVDTLEELVHEPLARGGIALLIGADALADLWRWRLPNRLLELATIAVVPKPNARMADPPVPHVPVPMPELAISSTLIRSRAAIGLPIRYLVPDSVASYIERERLYREP